jgi:excisionase family DNA binding protein
MGFLHPDEPGIGRRSRGGDAAFVSPSRLARHWGVHINTVYRDIRKGALPASRLPGGQFRIRISDARAYGRPVE